MKKIVTRAVLDPERVIDRASARIEAAIRIARRLIGVVLTAIGACWLVGEACWGQRLELVGDSDERNSSPD